jgi:hypothetical protein
LGFLTVQQLIRIPSVGALAGLYGKGEILEAGDRHRSRVLEPAAGFQGSLTSKG